MTKRSEAWKSKQRVKERHELIIALSVNGAHLKDIQLAVYSRFGYGPTGKLMDHSTVIHHQQTHRAGTCICAREGEQA